MPAKQNHKSLTTKQTHNPPTVSPFKFCKEEKEEETLRAQNKHTATKSSQSMQYPGIAWISIPVVENV
jgi:hypothetical protein